jgi:hypothetical protein
MHQQLLAWPLPEAAKRPPRSNMHNSKLHAPRSCAEAVEIALIDPSRATEIAALLPGGS